MHEAFDGNSVNIQSSCRAISLFESERLNKAELIFVMSRTLMIC